MGNRGAGNYLSQFPTVCAWLADKAKERSENSSLVSSDLTPADNTGGIRVFPHPKNNKVTGMGRTVGLR